LWPFLALNTATIVNMMSLIALLAELRAERGFSEFQLGVIVAAGYLATMAVQLMFGRFADVGWARTFVVAAPALIAASSFVMVITASFATAAASRVLLGLGSGLMGPALRRGVILADPARVTRNLSFITLTDLAGFVLGPLAAAALSASFGLNSAFIFAGLAIILVWPCALFVPSEPRRSSDSAPPIGFDLLARRAVFGTLILATLQFFVTGSLEAVWSVQLEDSGLSRDRIGLGFLVLAIPLGIGAALGGIVGDRATSNLRRMNLVTFAQLGAAGAIALLAVFYDSLTALFVVVAFAELPEDRQAAGRGLLGSSEVAFGAIGAFGSAWLYDGLGAGPMWAWLAACVVLAVAIANVVARKR
jgi:MFS family permease